MFHFLVIYYVFLLATVVPLDRLEGTEKASLHLITIDSRVSASRSPITFLVLVDTGNLQRYALLNSIYDVPLALTGRYVWPAREKRLLHPFQKCLLNKHCSPVFPSITFGVYSSGLATVVSRTGTTERRCRLLRKNSVVRWYMKYMIPEKRQVVSEVLKKNRIPVRTHMYTRGGGGENLASPLVPPPPPVRKQEGNIICYLHFSPNCEKSQITRANPYLVFAFCDKRLGLWGAATLNWVKGSFPTTTTNRFSPNFPSPRRMLDQNRRSVDCYVMQPVQYVKCQQKKSAKRSKHTNRPSPLTSTMLSC